MYVNFFGKRERTHWIISLYALVLWLAVDVTTIAQTSKHTLQPAVNTVTGLSTTSGRSEKDLYRAWRRQQIATKAISSPSHPASVEAPVSETQAILFNEGFEGVNFPPSGWDTAVVSGSPGWVQSNTSPRTGSYSAYSEFGPPAIPSEAYLITKSVSLNPLLLYRLTFWIHRGFVDIYDPDTVYVKLSTTDSLPSSFITALYKCYTGPDASTDTNIYTTTYKHFVVTIAGVGGKVWFAFDHANTYGQSIDLDDVKLEEIVNNDILAFSIDDPTAGERKQISHALTPTATFKNNGMQTQMNIPVRFKIYDQSLSKVYDNLQTIGSLSPGATNPVTFNSFTPSIPGTFIARVFAQNPGDTNPSNDSIEVQFRVPDNISGTRSVGQGGDFTTLANAVRYLRDNNVAGPLTFSLTGSMYNEPPLSIDQIYYTTTAFPVTFKPAFGVSTRIVISSTPSAPYGIRLKGSTHVTIDGSNSVGTKDLTIDVDTTGYFAPGILLTSGCQNVMIKNAVVKGFSRTDGTANSAIVIDTLETGRRDSNIVLENLSVLRGFNGFFIRGTAMPSANITISHCNLGGTGIDGLTQGGIVAYGIDSLFAIGNHVDNVSQSQAIVDVYGMFLGGGCSHVLVSGNIIHGVQNYFSGCSAYGLVNDAGSNSQIRCNNNFFYNIRAAAAGASPNYSIAVFSSGLANTGDQYYYNSINLYGHDSSDSFESFSTGFYFNAGSSTFQVKNNSIVNRMTFASTGPHAYALYMPMGIWPAGSSSDHNDLYTPDDQGATAFFGGMNRMMLSNWRSASSQDANSVSLDPMYVSDTDLHARRVGVRSPLDSLGIPVGDITTDIDGEERDPHRPDGGADEFSASTGIQTHVAMGWNMISVPVGVSDPWLDSIFPTARLSRAFRYITAYEASDTLHPGVGYWLKFSSAQSVEIVGTPLSKDTIDVRIGWNLVGSVSTPIAAKSILSDPPGAITSEFFGYEKRYTPSDTIYPGKGYWVKVTQAGKLILSIPSGSVEGLVIQPMAASRICIVHTSELPPAPPADLDVDHQASMVSTEFALDQNYPNPFNPVTVVQYQLPSDSRVTLKVYDPLGREVATLVDAVQPAGCRSIEWDGTSAASGVYFCRFDASSVTDPSRGISKVRRMVLLK